MKFEDDSQDRKRRFLRGLNFLLDNPDLEQDGRMFDLSKVCVGEFRERLANVYCIDLTKDEVKELMINGMTTKEFTEKYVQVIYASRGNVDMNTLIANSSRMDNGSLVVDIAEMDKSPKYGINGLEWCDVAEGPCSCGAWHK